MSRSRRQSLGIQPGCTSLLTSSFELVLPQSWHGHYKCTMFSLQRFMETPPYCRQSIYMGRFCWVTDIIFLYVALVSYPIDKKSWFPRLGKMANGRIWWFGKRRGDVLTLQQEIQFKRKSHLLNWSNFVVIGQPSPALWRHMLKSLEFEREVTWQSIHQTWSKSSFQNSR